jgi:hypothetical protein
MRAIPTAHAQALYFWSMRTASLASCGVGILAQEANAKATMPTKTGTDLISNSGSPGPANAAGALAQRLQPAADTRLVVAVGLPEATLTIFLLARDHAVAQGDGERQCEDKNPRTARSQADAGMRRNRPT